MKIKRLSPSLQFWYRIFKRLSHAITLILFPVFFFSLANFAQIFALHSQSVRFISSVFFLNSALNFQFLFSFMILPKVFFFFKFQSYANHVSVISNATFWVLVLVWNNSFCLIICQFFPNVWNWETQNTQFDQKCWFSSSPFAKS